MFRKTLIGASLVIGSLSLAGTAAAQGNCQSNTGLF